MNLPFRSILFWTHLISGLLAGLIIAVMSATGTLLAFEKELVVWSERDARKVDVPETAERLELEALLESARSAAGGAHPTTVVISADPADAVSVGFGRDKTYFINPYTGEAREPASTLVHDVMHGLEDWHRFLGLAGENRPWGKVINGSANLCFFALAVTGLYIWWPRRWDWRSVRGSVVFTRGVRGKARDWNWHNVIGLWAAPALIVLTLTAVPISFRWAGTGIYRMFGEAPPVQQGPGTAPSLMVSPPSPGAPRLKHSELLTGVMQQSPNWDAITLRLGGGGGNRPGSSTSSQPGSRTDSPRSEPRTSREIPAINFSVKERGAWPLFASLQYSVDPFTGAVLKKDGFDALSPARKVRSWSRFLHTGEAFGTVGKLLAGLASTAGVLLVYTGFALSWRRFFRRSHPHRPRNVSSPALAPVSK